MKSMLAVVFLGSIFLGIGLGIPLALDDDDPALNEIPQDVRDLAELANWDPIVNGINGKLSQSP
jgi:hypothetical protein